MRFIERCFTIVSDTDNFKQLDYTLISKILASSELLITSEIEVFNVAERWLNYNIEERSKYAKNILLKARLHLLSKDTKKQLLNDSTFLKTDDGCFKILNKILGSIENNSNKSSTIYHTSRYCSHKSFKLIAYGGNNIKPMFTCGNLSFIDVNNLGVVDAYLQMNTKRWFLNTFWVKGDLYVFGGQISKGKKLIVDKYSFTSKTWIQVAKMCDDRINFCACAFMDKIFVFGGVKDGIKTNSCLQFATSNNSWKEVSRTRQDQVQLVQFLKKEL